MYTTATMLAERYMEQIMSDPDWPNLQVNYNDSYPTRRDIPGYSAYKANLKVVVRPNTSNLLKEITVTVFWYDHGQENSLTIVNMRKRN